MGSTRHVGVYSHEDFSPATGGTESYGYNARPGYRINGNDEYARISIYIPKNFAGLKELAVLIMPYVTLNPMYMRVWCQYAQNGEYTGQHSDIVQNKFVNTVAYRLVEIDILDCVNVAPVDPGDYLGIQLLRNMAADPTHNTNCLVIGARYEMLLKRKAET